MLALLEKPDSGEIYFKNVPVADRPLAVRRKMAMVFRNRCCYPVRCLKMSPKDWSSAACPDLKSPGVFMRL